MCIVCAQPHTRTHTATVQTDLVLPVLTNGISKHVRNTTEDDIFKHFWTVDFQSTLHLSLGCRDLC